MASSFDSCHTDIHVLASLSLNRDPSVFADLPCYNSTPLTLPSRLLTSPIPPLFGMRPEKSSISGSSPAGSQRSDVGNYVLSTPRKSITDEDIVNADAVPPRRAQTSALAIRRTTRPSQRSQAASVVVNLYPQGSQTGPQANCGNVRSPSFPIRSQLEPETEGDDDDHGDRFIELLSEARDHFTNQEPKFVLKFPRVQSRVVEIVNNEVADLIFEYWDGKTREGVLDLRHC
jgi:hypothetical protein